MELSKFVEQARKKGLSDTQIREALTAQGWDKATIETTLAGLEVPKPSQNQPAASSKKTLSPLMAALHHVLLWFFTGSSTVTISGVVASLAGYEVSSEALAAMIAVTAVTFIPYSILFIIYLRQAHRAPGLIPGKVWSIITICLYSVAAMATAITLIVSLIVAGELNIIISAALILLLDLIVVITYSTAAFSPEHHIKLRRFITIAYLPVLLIMFGILFILSLMQLGPARHDEQLKDEMASTVQEIHSYASRNNALPENIGTITTNPEISYRKVDNTTYEICGAFKTATNEVRSTQASSDAYVSGQDFENNQSGHQCFEFWSEPLRDTR